MLLAIGFFIGMLGIVCILFGDFILSRRYKKKCEEINSHNDYLDYKMYVFYINAEAGRRKLFYENLRLVGTLAIDQAFKDSVLYDAHVHEVYYDEFIKKAEAFLKSRHKDIYDIYDKQDIYEFDLDKMLEENNK